MRNWVRKIVWHTLAKSRWPMKIDSRHREVSIAIGVAIFHMVAGFLLIRGSGPSFSPLPQAPVWAMAAQIVSDSTPDQSQSESTQVTAEDVALSPGTSAQNLSPEPWPLPLSAPSSKATPSSDAPPAMAAVSAEPQDSSGMLKVTPITLPDGPPVAFVPPPSMVGVVPTSKSQIPCRDLKKVSPQPRDTPQRGPDVPCDE